MKRYGSSQDQGNDAGVHSKRAPGGSRHKARRVVLAILLVLVIGVGGYLGYWVATGRFAVVETGRLYRSAELPPRRLVKICKRLGIRTVVDFRLSSAKVDAEAETLRHIGVKHVHLPTGQVPPSEVVEAFLNLMSDRENLPVLMHCEHGVGRTGVHAAIYRMEFQGWSNRRARLEAELLAGFGSFQKDTEKGRFLAAYTPHLRRERRSDVSLRSP